VASYEEMKAGLWQKKEHRKMAEQIGKLTAEITDILQSRIKELERER
jgi:hypothetical protein